jgi:hypothetical protein
MFRPNKQKLRLMLPVVMFVTVDPISMIINVIVRFFFVEAVSGATQFISAKTVIIMCLKILFFQGNFCPSVILIIPHLLSLCASVCSGSFLFLSRVSLTVTLFVHQSED